MSDFAEHVQFRKGLEMTFKEPEPQAAICEVLKLVSDLMWLH